MQQQQLGMDEMKKMLGDQKPTEEFWLYTGENQELRGINRIAW